MLDDVLHLDDLGDGSWHVHFLQDYEIAGLEESLYRQHSRVDRGTRRRREGGFLLLLRVFFFCIKFPLTTIFFFLFLLHYLIFFFFICSIVFIFTLHLFTLPILFLGCFHHIPHHLDARTRLIKMMQLVGEQNMGAAGGGGEGDWKEREMLWWFFARRYTLF